MLKGFPKPAYKIEVDAHRRGVADQLDNYMLALAKMLFSEDCIDNKTKYIGNVRKTS